MRAGLKTTALLFAALAAFGAGARTVEPLPGERWWGGATVFGREQPYGDFAARDQALDGFENQTSPFFVSSAGRYAWSERPIRFSAKGGALTLESAAPVEVVRAGGTLREAFCAAARRHFPPTGTIPPAVFFTHPQWNHYIESCFTGMDQKGVEDYARSIGENGFPLGVFMIDGGWQRDYGDWRFDRERFPDPKGMVDRLHGLGAKVMLWVVPYLSPDGKIAARAERERFVVERPEPSKDMRAAIVRWWSGSSLGYDFSVPAARADFTGILRGLQRDFGVDGFKFDGADIRHYTLATPTGCRFRREGYAAADNCRDYCRLAAEFPYNELRAAYAAAGLPLVQRLKDKTHGWNDLGRLVPDLLAAGILGYAYVCADMIGGGLAGSFRDPSFVFDHKLFVRSCQAQALMPMMQFSLAPWRVLTAEELAVCRAAAELHVSFAPYILDLARQASQTGEPVARVMEYEFPHEGLAEVRDQFMLGPDWLVAPVLRADGSRTVRLPKGVWRDDLGVTHTGPATLELKDVPLARLPRYRALR